MVIGVSLVLGITGTTAMIYSTENVRAASTSRADERSFSLAEAGLNYAYATLYNASDPLMPGAVPTRSEQVDNGTIMWWGVTPRRIPGRSRAVEASRAPPAAST